MYCPKIKICGLRTLSDAQLALELGASALGFNFYVKSPRFIEYEHARHIILQLGTSPMLVAVVVNPTEDDLKKIFDTGVNAIQFHGAENVDIANYARSIRPGNLQVIKAVQLIEKNSLIIREWSQFADIMLVDAFDPVLWGGSGRVVDDTVLDMFRDVLSKAFLAGGLTPENVGEKVLRFKPFGVDVASGVEISSGVKDPIKLRQFISRALGAT